MLRKTKLTLITTISSLLVATGLITGGYFLFSKLDKYKEYYINPVNNSPNGLVDAYKGAKMRGAEAIMCAGFDHQAPIEAAFNTYPTTFNDTAFLLFDSVVSKTSAAAANTWNINFRSDLGSIQVGIAAAVFLNYYQDVFMDDNKLTWATWGGQPYSSVTSFMGGFQKGIEWANKNLKGKEINNNPYKEITQITSTIGSDMTGGFGPSDGISTMIDFIKQRPDILMPVAGPQIWTAQTEIEKLQDSKTILIGVDAAVEDDSKNNKLKFKTKDGKEIGNGKRVQFSSLKDLSRTGQIALEIINNGNIIPEQHPDDPDRFKNFSATGATGEVSGLGTTAVGDSINGSVGVSEPGKKYLQEALKITGLNDPSLDEKYSEPENMKYYGSNNNVFDYGSGGFGLQQKFSLNNDTKKPNLDIKGFISNGEQADSSKIKVILSSAESILMDSSFSQSCYTGLYYFFKSMSINIPAPVGGSK